MGHRPQKMNRFALNLMPTLRSTFSLPSEFYTASPISCTSLYDTSNHSSYSIIVDSLGFLLVLLLRFTFSTFPELEHAVIFFIFQISICLQTFAFSSPRFALLVPLVHFFRKTLGCRHSSTKKVDTKQRHRVALDPISSTTVRSLVSSRLRCAHKDHFSTTAFMPQAGKTFLPIHTHAHRHTRGMQMFSIFTAPVLFLAMAFCRL